MLAIALPYLHRFVVSGIILGAFALPTRAEPFRVTMTVDNSYALFYGTHSQATNFVASDFDWFFDETFTFDLPLNRYIYIVTASDLSVAQGFLAQFTNLTTGYKFYSSDPQWQVMATGLGNTTAPYTGSAADLALLTKEIQDANAGGNPSNGWVGLTAGPNNGAGVWAFQGVMPGIDTAARWVWYSSNGDPDPTTPGFNHQEWLVFRISLAATPDNPVPDPATLPVPEPGTFSMLAIGLAGLFVCRKKLQVRMSD